MVAAHRAMVALGLPRRHKLLVSYYLVLSMREGGVTAYVWLTPHLVGL